MYSISTAAKTIHNESKKTTQYVKIWIMKIGGILIVIYCMIHGEILEFAKILHAWSLNTLYVFQNWEDYTPTIPHLIHFFKTPGGAVIIFIFALWLLMFIKNLFSSLGDR